MGTFEALPGCAESEFFVIWGPRYGWAAIGTVEAATVRGKYASSPGDLGDRTHAAPHRRRSRGGDASTGGGTFSDDNGNVHEANIEAIAADGITWAAIRRSMIGIVRRVR